MRPLFVLTREMERYGTARLVERNRRFATQINYEEGPVSQWPDVRWIWSEESPLPDWPNALGPYRLVSPRVREVLDAHLGPADAVQWIPSTVHHEKSGEDLEFWLLHFPIWFDVLHESTTWGPSGLPIRWIIDPAKLTGHRVVTVPQLIHPVIVDSEVLDALHASGAYGFHVAHARVP